MPTSETRFGVTIRDDWQERAPDNYTDDSMIYGSKIIGQWDRPKSDGWISVIDNAAGHEYTLQWHCGMADLTFNIGIEHEGKVPTAVETVMGVVDDFHHGLLPSDEMATLTLRSELAAAGIADGIEDPLADITMDDDWERQTGDDFNQHIADDESAARIAQWESETGAELTVSRTLGGDTYIVTGASELTGTTTKHIEGRANAVLALDVLRRTLADL